MLQRLFQPPSLRRDWIAPGAIVLGLTSWGAWRSNAVSDGLGGSDLVVTMLVGAVSAVFPWLLGAVLALAYPLLGTRFSLRGRIAIAGLLVAGYVAFIGLALPVLARANNVVFDAHPRIGATRFPDESTRSLADQVRATWTHRWSTGEPVDPSVEHEYRRQLGSLAVVLLGLGLALSPLARRARIRVPWWLSILLGLLAQLLQLAMLGDELLPVALARIALVVPLIVAGIVVHWLVELAEPPEPARGRRAALTMATALACALVVAGMVRPDALVASTNAGIAIGQQVPDLPLTDLDGSPVSLEESRGRVIVVAWWATWCSPCQAELAFLARTCRLHGDEGLAVLAVNASGEPSDAIRRQWLLEDRPFPALRPSRELVAALPPGLPACYVIDRRGLLRSRHVGYSDHDASAFEAELSRMLDE